MPADAITIDIAREPNLHRWAHPLVLPWLLLTPPLALGAYLAACGCLGELRWKWKTEHRLSHGFR